MTTLQELQDYPAAEQRTSDDLVKRIRKLRWIGMEEEARVLERTLNRASSAESVLAFPRETD